MTELDQALFLWINLSQSAPAWLAGLARTASQQLLPYLVVATVAAVLVGREPWRVQALRTLLALVLAAAAAYFLKRWFALPRPATLGLGVQWLQHGQQAGFPSSHATIAAAWAVAMAMVGVASWKRALFFLVPLIVGWSRIALGVHFPSDVLGGWALGALCAVAIELAAHALARHGRACRHLLGNALGGRAKR